MNYKLRHSILGFCSILSLSLLMGCTAPTAALAPTDTKTDAFTKNGTAESVITGDFSDGALCPIEGLSWGMSKAAVTAYLDQKGIAYNPDTTLGIAITGEVTAYGLPAKSALLNFTVINTLDLGLTRADAVFDASQQVTLESELSKLFGESTIFSGYPSWVSSKIARDYDTPDNTAQLKTLIGSDVSFEYGALDGKKEGFYTLNGEAPLYLIQLYDEASHVPEAGTLLCTMDRTYGNLIELLPH